MKKVLLEKLWAYIVQNNPDLMLLLQEMRIVAEYLEEKVSMVMPFAKALQKQAKPQDIIEQMCLDKMTEDLKPSRFLYVRSVIEDEFPKDYSRLMEEGTLTYEVVTLVELCKDIFENYDFNVENQGNRYLRHAIIVELHNFLS